VEWLGEVPEHWEWSRSDSRVRTSRELVEASELNGLEVYHYSIPAVQALGQGQLEDGGTIESSKFLVKEAQVLFAKLNPRKGTTCIARPKGPLTVCSGEFVPLIPHGMDLTFLHYLVQSEQYRTRLEAMVTSVTRSHQRVLPSDVVRFWWPFPSLNEQAIIASFLDRETAKIDELVAEQQRLMELLKEKRQAVISHAVTKGLNPDAPMKPSGVEWLGEVPAHWEVRRLSSLSTKITNGYVGPTRDILVDDGVRYLQSLHIKGNAIRFDIPYFVTEEWSRFHAKSVLETGDVLIVQTGDIGQSAAVPEEFAGCNCHALIVVAPVRDTVDGPWISWVLNSDYGAHTLRSIQTGALHPHLNCGDVKDVFIPLPPLKEQREIVSRLAEQLGAFNVLVDEAESAISLLTERRSALISAAVTGQIDVRHLATEAAA
jgi:type I restriction enzyme S subunit